ncbi:transposase [Mycolicibacterium moriokaense]|uniref:transposase n=1 Tax=Mycolicibacterium moriokaense TaxID=39691 RepID=UPI003B3A2270
MTTIRARWCVVRLERTVAAPQLKSCATRMGFDADCDNVLTLQARWRRLDQAMKRWPPTGSSHDRETTGVSAGGGDHIDGVCVGSRDWQSEPALRQHDWVFRGLAPTEYSSGASRAQGPITKTGNTHVRRLLVEAA